MFIFEDSDLINQKALISKILNGLKAPQEKLEKICLKYASQVNQLQTLMAKTEDMQKMNIFSKELEKKKNEMLRILAVKNRIDKLKSRNEQRFKFVDEKLKSSGIYDEKIDKQLVEKIEKENIGELSIDDLNLNESFTKFKYIDNERWKFVDGKLDFSDSYNKKLLLNCTDAQIHKIISCYPESVSTIDEEILLNTSVKKRVLKEIASYVSEKSESMDIREINKNLGGLLSFKTEIPNSVDGFIAGVQNMYAVMTKMDLIQKHPDKQKEINIALKCNEKSELIPTGKKKIAFANGLASDDTLDKNEESEEVRIQSEKEQQENVELNELLDLIFSDDEQEEQADLNNKEKFEDAKKQHKKIEEENEQAKEDEENLKMINSLRKDID